MPFQGKSLFLPQPQEQGQPKSERERAIAAAAAVATAAATTTKQRQAPPRGVREIKRKPSRAVKEGREAKSCNLRSPEPAREVEAHPGIADGHERDFLALRRIHHSQRHYLEQSGFFNFIEKMNDDYLAVRGACSTCFFPCLALCWYCTLGQRSGTLGLPTRLSSRRSCFRGNLLPLRIGRL